MRYFNFENCLMRTDAFIKADEEQLGVWFRLCVYCCEQLNNGMIPDASTWTDVHWIRSTGISSVSKITKESPLWHFNNYGALSVNYYPLKMQDAFKKQRAAGEKGGNKKQENRKALEEKARVPTKEPSRVAPTKGKVRKGKYTDPASGHVSAQNGFEPSSEDQQWVSEQTRVEETPDQEYGAL